MRYFLVLCLILMLTSLSVFAQDEADCDTEVLQIRLEELGEAFDEDSPEFRVSSGFLNALLSGCEEAVDLSELEINAGTPDEVCEQATPAITPEVTEFDEAEDVLEEGVDYQAIFCTDIGAIYFDLFEERTPLAVNNMVFLAQNNYYNNTIFHRVLEDFMAQGGDPTGTGYGDPGYEFDNEVFSDLEFDRPYLLAMANAGPDTNGSQFFITFVETPHLNMGYTIFGEVISGQDVVDDIMLRDPEDEDAPATTLLAVVIVTPEQVTEQ
jgi:cyclophilin family peptidyl-prolyl cis-trans isomerase